MNASINSREKIEFAATLPDAILIRLCELGSSTIGLLDRRHFRDGDDVWVQTEQPTVFLVQRDHCAVHVTFSSMPPRPKDEH